jgi:hypothetical protein
MTANVIVPLPHFRLPSDLPWRVRFIDLVEEQLRRLRASGHFLPPRFFGYYFSGNDPIAVAGSWTVRLEARAPLTELPKALERVTLGRFNIVGRGRRHPTHMLIHDRRDGACWLWDYDHGMRFVESLEPVEDQQDEEAA